MLENKDVNDVAVDRRAETVVTQQPGYAATEQVTRDVAAESRLRYLQINRIMYTLLAILEILLGLRFVLKLIAANPNSGFTVFIYGITNVFVAPFNAIIGTPTVGGGSIIEATTLIAMAVYALLFWVLARVIHIAAGGTTARTVTRTTSEHTPGNEHTTHTTTRN